MWPTRTAKWVAEALIHLLVPLLSAWAEWSSGRGPREIKNVHNLQVRHCWRSCKHLARRRRTSSTSTRPGSDKKGAEFRIWWQTDFPIICTVVWLIRLHENPQNIIWGLSGGTINPDIYMYIYFWSGPLPHKEKLISKSYGLHVHVPLQGGVFGIFFSLWMFCSYSAPTKCIIVAIIDAQMPFVFPIK